MKKFDSYHNVKAVPVLVPAVKTAAGDGATIDTRDFGSVLFVVETGTIASDGDFGLVVEDAVTGSGDWETTTDVLGAFPATLEASTVYRVGYIGHKRYARLRLTKAGGTSIALGAVAILGRPAVAPVA